MAAPTLSDIEIQRALGELPGWSRRGDVLTKSYTAPSFPAGIAFVQRIADAAEAANHHPDIDIRYTKIVIVLSTHDSGGITSKDVQLAKDIERLQHG
jgi:4a-hydroxytetrahydrobiopterin dehydratase